VRKPSLRSGAEGGGTWVLRGVAAKRPLTVRNVQRV
jgi:hypothetical protein